MSDVHKATVCVFSSTSSRGELNESNKDQSMKKTDTVYTMSSDYDHLTGLSQIRGITPLLLVIKSFVRCRCFQLDVRRLARYAYSVEH